MELYISIGTILTYYDVTKINFQDDLIYELARKLSSKNQLR